MTAPDAARFREAMSHVPMAVHVVTTDGPAGRHGATATAVTNVTDSPPTLLVCLNLSSTAHRRIAVNGVLAVNLLGAEQESVARAFSTSSGGRPDGRFDHGTWDTLATGVPTLVDAVATFDGRVTHVRRVGSHAVLFVEVDAVRLGGAGREGLIYHRRDYASATAAG